MADQRDGGIAWTDETWGPVRGCSRVSEGCRNCYAERMAARFSGPGGVYEGLVRSTSDGPRWTGEVRLVPERLGDPLRWKRPRRVFVNSMSDLFHESLPFEHIAAIFGVMAAAPQHTFQVLTKRPERAAAFFAWVQSIPGNIDMWPAASFRCVSEISHLWPEGRPRIKVAPWPLPNVWIGASVEDQKTADARTPLLLSLPAAWRFISYEPALGPVDFTSIVFERAYGTGLLNALTGEKRGHVPNSPLGKVGRLDLIIYGGESGPNSRPNDIAWARSTRDQCAAAGTAFFMKQLGARSYDGEAPNAVMPNEARITVASERGLRAAHAVPGFVRQLSDRAGANPAEWPADLRVREFPRAANTQGGA